MVTYRQSMPSLAQQIAEQRFWLGVDLTLEKVFNASPELGVEYRRVLNDAPEAEKTITYHATPLQIAADLTATRDITDEHFRAYIEAVVPQLQGNPFRRPTEEATTIVRKVTFDVDPGSVKKRRWTSRIGRTLRRALRKIVD